MKNLIITIFIITFVSVLFWILSGFYKPSDLNKNQSTTGLLVKNTPESTGSNKKEFSEEGIVSGKLCYPSEFLPEGVIEAKNVATGKISETLYEGSKNGGSSNYTMKLLPGTYIFRYKAVISPNNVQYGYHTTTCMTGVETTCASSYKREHANVIVISNETTKMVDLCDFYYDQKVIPSF